MNMNENDLLRKKFRDLGHDKISDMIRDTKSELTQETWGAIINRGKKPELKTLLKMCADLNFTSNELVEILKTRGEKQIAAWISPNTLTSEEQTLVEKFRALNGDHAKTKLVKDLLDNLKG